MNYNVTVNGKVYSVTVEKTGAAAPAAVAPVAAPVAAAPVAAPAPAAAPATVAAGETAVNSPMPGNIFKVECSVGQAVKAGDVLVVKAVAATVGTAVNTDDLLVTLG